MKNSSMTRKHLLAVFAAGIVVLPGIITQTMALEEPESTVKSEETEVISDELLDTAENSLATSASAELGDTEEGDCRTADNSENQEATTDSQKDRSLSFGYEVTANEADMNLVQPTDMEEADMNTERKEIQKTEMTGEEFAVSTIYSASAASKESRTDSKKTDQPDRTLENQKGNWIQAENGWQFFLEEEKNLTTGWNRINDKMYFFDEFGIMASEIWIEDTFYIKQDGALAVDQWIDRENYVDSQGRKVENAVAPAPIWKKDDAGWWLQYCDGSYAKKTWEQVNGKSYYFNEAGYMLSSQWIDGVHYVKHDGARALSEWVDDCRYFVNEEGKWVPDKSVPAPVWQQDDTGWWLKRADGSYPKNRWYKTGGNYYYFDGNGYMMKNRWIEGVYWLKDCGAMAKDAWVDDCQYYVNKEGRWVPDKAVPAPVWQQDDTGWWLKRADGSYPKSRWYKTGDDYYYFDGRGYKMSNCWIEGKYWLKDNGAMARSAWVDNCTYYVDQDGCWVPGKTVPEPNWEQDEYGKWLRRADGWYPKDTWLEVDGEWYRFNKEGYVLTSQEVDGCFVKSDGARAVSEFIRHNGQQFYYGETGEKLYGEQKIDGYWYCFEHETGAMMTGLVDLDASYTKKPKTVYYNNKGQMQYGQQIIGNKIYTFDEKTGALQIITQQRLRGIDISEHQGSINFSKVANEVSFAILRSGYSIYTDKRFFEYVDGCNRNGIAIPAVYCFSYALNEQEAIDEARYTMNLIERAGLSKDTIVFYDFEYDSIRYANQVGVHLGKRDCMRFTDAFCNEVERHGYTSGVYANLDYYNHMYEPSSFKNRVFWFARYQDQTEYECNFHQYGSTGHVSGIKGNVDMNWWYM